MTRSTRSFVLWIALVMLLPVSAAAQCAVWLRELLH